MEWQRVVEIHGGPRGQHGSGYLLAPGLALTARHVVAGLQFTELRLLEPDELGFPGRVGAWQDARVAWASPDADLALLAAAESKTFRDLPGATTVGRLDGRAPVRVHAMGFPRALAAPTHSDVLQLQASINAWSGARSDALLLDVQTSRPAEDNGWKGMSGAAVFAGDRLVGVVEAVPTKLDGLTLRATPAYLLFADEPAGEVLRPGHVELATEPVDAKYVDKLPLAGSWGGTREQYARAVVETFCSIDFLGLAVAGAPDRRTPALAAFTARKLRSWPDEPPPASR
jgi:hypothetical protein